MRTADDARLIDGMVEGFAEKSADVLRIVRRELKANLLTTEFGGIAAEKIGRDVAALDHNVNLARLREAAIVGFIRTAIERIVQTEAVG